MRGIELLGVRNVSYAKYEYSMTVGEVYDNIPINYGLTMVIEGNISGNAALFTVGYRQAFTHLISDTASLIGNYFNVEHGTINGPYIKITPIVSAKVVVVTLG